jgi:hypothetical protein
MGIFSGFTQTTIANLAKRVEYQRQALRQAEDDLRQAREREGIAQDDDESDPQCTRADVEAAPRVRKALLARREAMLLTATVDEIIAFDDGEIRRLNIKVEIAKAKAEAFGQKLAFIEREYAKWAGIDMPSDEQLKKLLALVEREHPRLIDRERDRKASISRNFDAEFKSAFFGVGHVARLSSPSQKIAFDGHVDRVNNTLRRRGHTDVGGDMIFAALIAWGDCDYRFNDRSHGQIAECSLDPLYNTGRAPKSVWRDILAGGAQLRSPLPPRGSVTLEADRAPRPRILERGSDGSMHEIAR